MKLFLTFVVAIFAIGCGDATGPGAGDPDGGVSASCRPPAGCDALLENGACSYFCASRSVCLTQPDGGLYDPRRAISLSEVDRVRAVDLRSDPMNCSSCGRVCPTGTTCSGGVCR